MDECDLEFINSIPKPAPGPALVADEWLFARRPGHGPQPHAESVRCAGERLSRRVSSS